MPAAADGWGYRKLAELLDVPEWFADAACKGVDPALFFPDEALGEERDHYFVQAKRVCLTCPVRLQCLEHALATGERHGVWGGMVFNSHWARSKAIVLAREIAR